MPTRQSTFQTSAFHTPFSDSIDLLEELSPPLEATSDHIQNFSRLKKAMFYTRDLISAADIDLVPISVWQNFLNPSNNIKSYLTQYSSSKNAGYIDNANTQVDSLLQYLSPYVITGKGAAQAAGKALARYSKVIESQTERIEQNVNRDLISIQEANDKASSLLKNINSSQQQIENYSSELFQNNDEKFSLKSQIDNLFEKSTKLYDRLEKYATEILGDGVDEDDSLRVELLDAKEEIIEAKTEALETKKDLEATLADLKHLHTQVFGTPNDDDELVGGVLSEFDAARQKFDQFRAKQREEAKALADKINALLPDATSAGLASAYANQKKSYQKPIRNFTYVFYISVAILFAIGIWTLTSISQQISVATEFGNKFEVLIVSTLARLPLALPVVWLAYFSSKRRNENRRLEEEYAHKETIARSFHSFKQQVEKLGSEETILSAKLLDAAISSAAFNASSTLDKNHDDKLPNIDQMNNLQKTYAYLKNITRTE